MVARWIRHGASAVLVTAVLAAVAHGRVLDRHSYAIIRQKQSTIVASEICTISGTVLMPGSGRPLVSGTVEAAPVVFLNEATIEDNDLGPRSRAVVIDGGYSLTIQSPLPAIVVAAGQGVESCSIVLKDCSADIDFVLIPDGNRRR